MRILLLGNYRIDRQESMLRYAAILKSGMQAIDVDVHAAAPPARFGRWLKSAGAGAVKWGGYVDKFLFFPLQLRKLASLYDLVHICDHSNAPWLHRLNPDRALITVHDLLAVRSALGEFPKNQTRWSGRQLQAHILRGLRNARHVIWDSTATREDYVRILGPAQGIGEVVPAPMNYPFRPMPEQEATNRIARLYSGVHPPFVLHVGSDAWYKNRSGVIEIFGRAGSNLPAGTELWLVGPPLSEQDRALANRFGISDHVRSFQRVPEEDLCALYSLALCLLFPSLHEGFGWPLAEAQACGCPVLSSARAPMTEVGGEHAIFMDPAKLDKAAEVLTQVSTWTPDMRVARGRLAEEHARRLQPEQVLPQLVAIYHRILGDSRR